MSVFSEEVFVRDQFAAKALGVLLPGVAEEVRTAVREGHGGEAAELKAVAATAYAVADACVLERRSVIQGLRQAGALSNSVAMSQGQAAPIAEGGHAAAAAAQGVLLQVLEGDGSGDGPLPVVTPDPETGVVAGSGVDAEPGVRAPADEAAESAEALGVNPEALASPPKQDEEPGGGRIDGARGDARSEEPAAASSGVGSDGGEAKS